ncbi:hypothetical protein BN946_scf184830.g9 [Trametes cinnabarina]|uniref:PIG-P domain-containing protein n=1 Tax=Pycnoporus cinnabarinus TaxID=5643 RepID=A0A060S8Z0_PYCCI|nr:hypothetical protein BN946_scf184830.g9 [Trametes cinnabarina]
MATFASESVAATTRKGNEPTSPVSPLAPYPPVLPTESRSRAPEFYGFVAWASTYLLFVLYLLWAFLPDEYIVALGVSWYPNREWSLLIPAYGMVTVLLTYFTYFALALAGTPAFDDMSTITALAAGRCHTRSAARTFETRPFPRTPESWNARELTSANLAPRHRFQGASPPSRR